MAIGERQWYDFIIFTTKGISIERINHDQTYRESKLLVSYYYNCVAPEVISPVYALGLPVRNLAIAHHSTN